MLSRAPETNEQLNIPGQLAPGKKALGPSTTTVMMLLIKTNGKIEDLQVRTRNKTYKVL